MMEMRWHIGKPVQRFVLAAGIVFVLALLTGPFPKLAAVMEAGMRLLFGWLSYLVQTLPTLRLDVVPLLYGALGFVFACFAMHRILRTFRAQENSEDGPRWKHSVGIATGVSIMLGLGVMAGGIVEQVLSFPQGNWVQAQWSERAFAALNRGRANHIAGQIRAAAEENDGCLPLQFHDVWGEDRVREAAYMMPFRSADPTALEEFWVYLGGTKVDSAVDIPVLAAPHPDKNGKRIVAFLDTTVTECTEEEWQAALERWRRAVKGSEEQKVTEAAR